MGGSEEDMSDDVIIKTVGIKHCRKLTKPGEPRYILAALYDDGAIVSCVYEKGSTEELECCHTELAGGPDAYFAWVAHLCSPEVGFREEPIEVEKEDEEQLRERIGGA